MMMGRSVCRQKVSAAHPEPSALAAVWENSFLIHSHEPYSSSMTLAIGPEGFPPPPALVGARFFQNSEWSTCPPIWNESSLNVAFASKSALSVLALSIFWRMALADRKSTRLNSSHLGISYAVF